MGLLPCTPHSSSPDDRTGRLHAWPLLTAGSEGRCGRSRVYLSFGLGVLRDAAGAILQVGPLSLGSSTSQRVVQQVQIFLDLGTWLCGVLLRVQDLREARGVRLRDRREETARHPAPFLQPVPAGPRHRAEASSHLGTWLSSPLSLGSLRRQHGLQSMRQCSDNRAVRCPSRTRMRGCPPGAPAPRQPPGPRTGPLPGGRTRRNPSPCSLPLLSAAVCVSV